jgi:hypothetical protein
MYQSSGMLIHGKIDICFAASGTPVAMKHRGMETVIKS